MRIGRQRNDATSSSSSVQMPPSPRISAGTTPSVRAAMNSSTPGAAIRSARTTAAVPRGELREPRVRGAHLGRVCEPEDHPAEL